MEVTRQLRVDRVTKTGLAPIMLTCWWDNQRLRLMPGEKCLLRTYPTASWLNYKIVRTLVDTWLPKYRFLTSRLDLAKSLDHA